MNTRIALSSLLSLVSIAALAGAAACTTTSTTTTTGDGGSTASKDGSAADDDASTGGDDASTGGDDASTATGDQACVQEASQQACIECCGKNHQTGAQVLTKVAIDCGCNGIGAEGTDGGAGACATECAATICAATPKNPDATCNACLQASVQQGGACATALATSCNADADCKALQACGQPCQKL